MLIKLADYALVLIFLTFVPTTHAAEDTASCQQSHYTEGDKDYGQEGVPQLFPRVLQLPIEVALAIVARFEVAFLVHRAY